MQANGWFNSGYGNGLLNSIALYMRWCIQGLIMSWQWDTLSTVINLLWLIPTQQKQTTWQTLAVTTPTMEFKTWWPVLLLVVQTCHSLVASFCALWRKTRLLPKPVRREVEKPWKAFSLQFTAPSTWSSLWFLDKSWVVDFRFCQNLTSLILPAFFSLK